MAINEAYAEFRKSSYLSGDDNLGNTASSTVVTSQNASFDGSGITGVTIINSFGNTLGTGTLSYVNSSTSLTWQASGDSVGIGIDVSTDGKYAIRSANLGMIAVSVVSASLPGGDTNDTVTVATELNELFDDVQKSEAWGGDNEYACFYIYNSHSTDPFLSVKMYIGSHPSGPESFWIGLDPTGVGAGGSGSAVSIINESTAPAGVTFFNPTTIGSALDLGQIDSGQFYPLWVRRQVPVASVGGLITSIGALKFEVIF